MSADSPWSAPDESDAAGSIRASVAASRADDLDELAVVYRRWAGRCFAVASVVTDDPQIAEGAVLDAFCAWWRDGDRARSDDDIGMHLLTASLRNGLQLMTEPVRPAAYDPAMHPRQGQIVGAGVIDPWQRQVLVLTSCGGRTFAQVAEATGASVAAVRAAADAALRRLRPSPR